MSGPFATNLTELMHAGGSGILVGAASGSGNVTSPVNSRIGTCGA